MQRLVRSFRKSQTQRGDTIIEVSFAIAIFALVSIISITLMNTGVTMSEANLEATMARNEIDAQAEALRFIQNSYLSEKELISSQQVYKDLWNKIVSQAINPDGKIDKLPVSLAGYTSNNHSGCDAAYNGSTNIYNLKSFIVNTRNIDPANVNKTIVVAKANENIFKATQLSPRVIFSKSSNNSQTNEKSMLETNLYNSVSRVEGIWVTAVKQKSTKPEFYDFHIRTCWYAVGKSTPNTIATIVRLYNPDLQVEKNKAE